MKNISLNNINYYKIYQNHKLNYQLNKGCFKMKIAIVLGTRPEIIKMASVMDEIEKRGHELLLFIPVSIMIRKCLRISSLT